MEFNSSFEGQLVLLSIKHYTWSGLCFFTEDKTKVAFYDGEDWLAVGEFLGLRYIEEERNKLTEKELYLIDADLIKLSNDKDFWHNPVRWFIEEFGTELYQDAINMRANPPEWLRSEKDYSGMIFNPYNNSWSFF